METLNHCSYFQAFWKSFSSPDVYLDAVKRWRGVGLCYLFLLSCILSVPVTARIVQNILAYTATIQAVLPQMPSLIIKDGKIHLPSPMLQEQIMLRNAQGDVIVVIDTTRLVDDFNITPVPLLITRDAIRIEMVSGFDPTKKVLRSIKINRQWEDSVLDRERLEEMLQQMDGSILLYNYEAMTFLIVGTLLSVIIFMGYTGRWVARTMWGIALTIKQSMRLSALAVTPSALVASLFFYMNNRSPMLIAILFFIAMLYYFFGARENRFHNELF